MLQIKDADDKALALLKSIASCYNELGDLDNEIQTHQAILDLSRQLADSSASERSMLQLSALYLKKKDFKSAIAANTELLALATASGNVTTETQVYNNLGYLHYLDGNITAASQYLNKSYDNISNKSILIKDDDKAKILINLGVASINMNMLENAEKYFNEAYQMRKSQNDKAKIAEALNFLATYDYMRGKLNQAIDKAEESIQILSQASYSEFQTKILIDTYKMMCELMLAKKDIASFRKYNALLISQQEELVARERRRNNMLLQFQLESERAKNEIQNLRMQEERQELLLSQAVLEKEKNEKELLLRTNELAMLKNERDLREQRLKNSELEKNQISQNVALLQNALEQAEQRQKIQEQDVQLATRKQEIETLSKEHEQSRKNRIYNSAIIGLLGVLLIIALQLHRIRSRKNKLLSEQNDTIKRMNQEMLVQNEELTAMNERLNEHTTELNHQHIRMIDAQLTISEQNKKLLSYNRNLEEQVLERTQEIRKNNTQLMEYANRLENFAFALSHNLRAPIARLLGLVNIMGQSSSPEETGFITRKIYESAYQLDDVIRDLSIILEQNATQNLAEVVNLDDVLNKSLLMLQDELKATNATIVADLQAREIFAINAFMESIFYNLISNGIKYRADDRECRIEIFSRSCEGHVEIIVRDNGIGIDLKQFGDKMFGLYKRFNIHTEGKGLGLFLVKSHVEAMGGTIEVASDVGDGTIFTIKLNSQHRAGESSDVTQISFSTDEQGTSKVASSR